MYIVLNATSGGVCCRGQKPFIGQKENAQALANELKTQFPSDEYVLASVTPLKEKGQRSKVPSEKKQTKRAKSLQELPAILPQQG